MPIGVNLLPWRVERDQRARRRVWMAMPTAAGLGLGVMLVATLVMREARLDMQMANERTRQQIAALADQRAVADQLEQTHGVLNQRMATMQGLLAGRTRALTALAGLVEALPEVVHLVRIERGAERMVIEGIAPDPDSISRLVSALKESTQLPALRFERLGTHAAEGSGHDRFRIAIRNAAEPATPAPSGERLGQ